MSMKTNSIRKRAQNYVRKLDWPNAIKEYKHLIEVDTNNPNLFNELGDLYLKVGNKPDAFRNFQKAIAEYKKVSLYNNAIAVCKKVLRYDPGSLDVLFTLGQLRKVQGITKEAVSYFVSYMEKLVLNVKFDPEDQKVKLRAIAEEMPTSPEVLERVAEYLLKWDFKSEAGEVMARLADLYKSTGRSDEYAKTKKKLDDIGYEIPAAETRNESYDEKKGDLVSAASPAEGNTSDAGDYSSPPKSGRGPASQAKPGASANTDHIDYGNIEFDRTVKESSGDVSTQTIEKEETQDVDAPVGQSSSQPDPTGRSLEVPDSLKPEDGEFPDQKELEPKSADQGSVVSHPDGTEQEEHSTIIISKTGGPGGVVHVSKIIDEFKDEVKEVIEDEDFHTHYDLGMAYLEMDLLPEAIREFQFASKSTQYQISSLEMIGLCFIKQNQPNLAIKQLERGLSLAGSADRNALGLLYTLALAYEMVGDVQKAKDFFEDVYVVDVSFRDVEEKIRKYSS